MDSIGSVAWTVATSCMDLFRSLWNIVEKIFIWIASLCCPHSTQRELPGPPAVQYPAMPLPAVPEKPPTNKSLKRFCSYSGPSKESFASTLNNLGYNNLQDKELWISDFFTICMELQKQYTNDTAGFPFMVQVYNNALLIIPTDQTLFHCKKVKASVQELAGSETLQKVKFDNVSDSCIDNDKIAIRISFVKTPNPQ